MTFTTAFTVCAHTQKPAEYREQGLGFSFSGLTITFKLKGAHGPLAQSLHLAHGTERSGRPLSGLPLLISTWHPRRFPMSPVPSRWEEKPLRLDLNSVFLSTKYTLTAPKMNAVRCGMKSRVLLEVHEFLKALELIRVSLRLAFLPEVWENHKDSGLDFHTSAWWVKKMSSVFLWWESSLNFHLSESHIKLPITPYLPLQLTHFGFWRPTSLVNSSR